MKEKVNNLVTRIDQSLLHNAGIAYVCLPSDIDRDTYISQCYTTATVSIFSERNGFYNRVPIDVHSLNFVTFPQVLAEFGSAVSFIVDPVVKRPIITGLYFKNDELSALQENQFRFKRELNGNSVEITGSPDGKYLHLNVTADSAGEVSINVSSQDQSAKVSFEVDGDVNVNATGNTNIRQGNQFTLSTIADTADDTKVAIMRQRATSHLFIDEEHDINTDKFSINAGEEPFILGKQWASFMKNFINEVANSTVETPMGLFPLFNSEQIAAYEDQVDALLSVIGFIDK